MKFLGLDIGTGGSRAILLDENGKVGAAASRFHVPFNSPHVGWAEQDPRDWWQAASGAIRELLQSTDPSEIACIGLSGQMHGSVFLDSSDEVLHPALLWCDQRTASQCTDITAKIGPERLIELVCNPAVTGFTLPKILWFRENRPDLWKKTNKILLPKDYVRLCLSGDSASDVADSSGTLLFDVQRRQWSDEMLDAFEIERNLLPNVYESQEITGRVSHNAARETGLKEGTLIVAGAGDNAAGAIGMGIVNAGNLSVTIGTSGVVFVVTKTPTLDLKGRLHTLCHAIPGRWHMTGVTLAAGLSLKWFRDQIGSGKSFEEIDAAAAEAPAGSEGAIWLPYLMGERTPHLDPNARAAMIGLTASHTFGHLARAVMEGVSFSLRDAIEIFRELGTETTSIRLGGGGAKSPVWRQIQADAYGQQVETIDIDEGAALGAAILAGVGAGAWANVDEACSFVINVAETVQPDSDSASVLEKNYAVYRNLYAALKPLTS